MDDCQLDFFENYNSLDPKSETRICIKCKKEKPLDYFRSRDRGSFRRTECRKCELKLQKERKRLREITPPPPDDYICPICRKEEKELLGRGGKNNGAWVNDHDHETGEFRGYLCHSCNRNIGGFNDSIESLERAIKYLKKND